MSASELSCTQTSIIDHVHRLEHTGPASSQQCTSTVKENQRKAASTTAGTTGRRLHPSSADCARSTARCLGTLFVFIITLFCVLANKNRAVGYSVIALNQTVQKKVDPKTHVNTLDPLLAQLRKRDRLIFVKRLTIVLDEDSEKGFGLVCPPQLCLVCHEPHFESTQTTGNVSIFNAYDLIALLPTTVTAFSQACLSHTSPSNLTAHIISLPLTLPRLPFNLKHTLIRTAIKNGAVFEVTYAGALGGDSDATAGTAASSEGGAAAKRNWWAAAREVVRVTKGKGIIVASGVTTVADLRAPRDVGNL